MAYTTEHVFGPVPSRRLGYSLGIDIIPPKTCNLNCIYCQLGRTTAETLTRREYVAVETILKEVEGAIRNTQRIDYLTFSGSGEPTLNTRLGEMIRRLKTLTAKPVAVITNGTLLYLPEVRADLLAADVVMPSLDAASAAVFHRINRPHGRLRIEAVIEGQIRFRQEYHGQLWLEILLVRGVNDTPDELARLRAAVEQIRPDRLQLNTVARPPAEENVETLSPEEMDRIRTFFGGNAEIIARFHHSEQRADYQDLETAILALAARHAVTIEDICQSLGREPRVITARVEAMCNSNKLQRRRYANQDYFVAAPEILRCPLPEENFAQE